MYNLLLGTKVKINKLGLIKEGINVAINMTGSYSNMQFFAGNLDYSSILTQLIA